MRRADPRALERLRGSEAPLASYLLAVGGNLSLWLAGMGEPALHRVMREGDSLWSAPGASGGFLLVASGFLLLWAFFERVTSARLPGNVARALDFTAVTAVIVLAAMHFALNETSFLVIGYILAGCQISRALRRKTRSDVMLMHGIAVAQAALGAFLCRSTFYPPILLLCVVLGAAASIRLTTRPGPAARHVRLYMGRPRGSAGMRSRLGALVQPVLVAAGVVAIGGILFVILPRGAAFQRAEELAFRPDVNDPTDYSKDEEEGPQAITGFREDVRLGDVGSIKEVPWPAFLVRTKIGGLPARLPDRLLYFRAAVLDAFDGEGWSRGPERRAKGEWLSMGGGAGVVSLRPGPPVRGAGFRKVEQEFEMRATVSRVLPALDGAVSITLTPSLPRVRSRGDWTCHAEAGLETGLVYQVTSCVPSDPQRRVMREVIEEGAREPFLRLPEGMERVSELAREIGGKGAALQVAHRLTAWLKEHCEYTLLFAEDPTGRPVETFLFESHAGHCEYFATSLALMLRACGVPSRLVVGWRGGQWFEDEEAYFVRQNAAHAWVEAWLPDGTWVRLDPTPGDTEAVSVPPARVPGGLRLIGDGARPEEHWADAVRGFGAEERRAVLAGLGRGVSFVVREGFGPGRPLRSFPPPITALALAWILAWGARRLVRGRRGAGPGGRGRKGPGKRGGRAEAAFYDLALSVLARRGLVRRESQSPGEFERSLRRMLAGQSADFRRITRAFEGVRYGGRDVPAEEESLLLTKASGLVEPSQA